MEPMAGRALVWAVALAAACGAPPDPGGIVDSVDDTDEVDTPRADTMDDTDAPSTDDTVETDTPPAVPAEDCADPGDEDGDGLADCEDGDCVAVCVEDCAAPGDEDNDGWTDCQDEECWGPGCPPASQIAWVTEGRLTLHAEYYTGGSCTNRAFSYTLVVAESVAGRVAVDRGGRWVTCHWQVPSARFHRRHQELGWLTSSVVHGPFGSFVHHGCLEFTQTSAPPVSRRGGVNVDPACGLSAVTFLPRELTADRHRPISVTTPHGGAWYTPVSSTSQSVTGVWLPGIDVVATLGTGAPFGVCPTGLPVAAGAGWTCLP